MTCWGDVRCNGIALLSVSLILLKILERRGLPDEIINQGAVSIYWTNDAVIIFHLLSCVP